jgi:hypothetical protein
MEWVNRYTGAIQECIPLKDSKDSNKRWNTFLERPSVQRLEERFVNIPQQFQSVNIQKFTRNMNIVPKDTQDFIWNVERCVVDKIRYIHWYEFIILN